MKPASFEYSRPTEIDEAVKILADLGPEGKVLAGGQSLVPLLSMRLAAPSHLVDINRINDLAYIDSQSRGVRIGALVRHAALEGDVGARDAQPLLSTALKLVAHPTIRNRGTTVGSIVHADPAAEMPAVLALLGGTVTAISAGGRRTIAAADFFLGAMESALRPGELAVEAFFPSSPPQSGTAFAEVSRRHGDYAVCGAASLVTLDDDLRIRSVRASYLSISAAPLVIDLTDVIGGRLFDADIADVAVYVRDRVDPETDIHASAEYRRHLAEILTARVVRDAARNAADAAIGASA
ncbi:FAD binding domain-containing protein [Jatrophihabitans sp. DSM 45814]